MIMVLIQSINRFKGKEKNNKIKNDSLYVF